MHKNIRRIRLSMGYSIAEFAELLALPKSTYQCYENHTRPLPEEVLKNILEARERDVKFFKNLPLSVDKALKGRGVPNAAVPWQ